MRSPANPQRAAVLVVLAVAGLSALAGCYTVLKHPPTAEVQDRGERRRDCFDCHGGSGPGHLYDPMVAYGFDYLADDWYPWYAYPWWYRDYWYWDRYDHSDEGYGGGGTTAGNPDDGRRHLWGPGMVYRPPKPPVIPVPTPGGVGSVGVNPPPGSTQPSQQVEESQPGRTMKSKDESSQGSTGSGSNGSGSGAKTDSKDDSKKKEDDKGGRSTWSRGGSKGGGRQ